MDVVEIINAFKKGEIDSAKARAQLAEACHPSRLEVTPAIAEYIYVKACDLMGIGHFDFDYEDEN